MTIADQDGAVLRAPNATAANEDHLGHNVFLRSLEEKSASDSGGWDAYDVWRRLIKEARDRRSGAELPR